MKEIAESPNTQPWLNTPNMYYCFLHTSNHRTLLHSVETVLQLITGIDHGISEGECCKCVLHEYVLVNYATKHADVLHAVQCGGGITSGWRVCLGMLKGEKKKKMCLHRAVFAILLPTTLPLSPPSPLCMQKRVGTFDMRITHHVHQSTTPNDASRIILSLWLHLQWHVRILRVFHQLCARFRFGCVSVREVRAHKTPERATASANES